MCVLSLGFILISPFLRELKRASHHSNLNPFETDVKSNLNLPEASLITHWSLVIILLCIFILGTSSRSNVLYEFILSLQKCYSDNWLCLCVHVTAVGCCLSVHWHCRLEWATTPKDKSQSVFKLSPVLWTRTYLEVGSISVHTSGWKMLSSSLTSCCRSHLHT